MKLRPLSAALLAFVLARALCPLSCAGELAAADSATTFINTRENVWYKYKSPDIQEAYPFGRSNRAHNAELDKIFDANTAARTPT